MNRSVTLKSLSILQKLSERKSSGKNDVKCRLYQARHANDGKKIPAKILMEELGGAFPKAYNSRVNKVYDWKDRKYQKEEGDFVSTRHREYLKGGIEAPSLSSEYKEILAYENRIYAYASTYLETNSLPAGIKNSKELAERYILDLEHERLTEIKEIIEKGKELFRKPRTFDVENDNFYQELNSIKFQLQAIISGSTLEQKNKIKNFILKTYNEI